MCSSDDDYDNDDDDDDNDDNDDDDDDSYDDICYIYSKAWVYCTVLLSMTT